MQKLVRSTLAPLSFETFFRQASTRFPNISQAQAREEYESVLKEEVWINDTYQVNLNRTVTHGFERAEVWHLSIKRLDKGAIHDWREFQAIKSQLCGPEAEGIELYPAESRLIDTSNQYHLFIFVTPGFRLPIGFHAGRHVLDDTLEGTNTRQRSRT